MASMQRLYRALFATVGAGAFAGAAQVRQGGKSLPAPCEYRQRGRRRQCSNPFDGRVVQSTVETPVRTAGRLTEGG